LIKHVPGITIATDIICGFPYETPENFEETLDLIRKYKFPVINISQFYSRPGTVAAKWKKVDSKEVKRRSTETAKLFKSYSNYDNLKNTIQRVWIHDTKDEGRNPDENVMVGHTKSYVKVLIKRDQELVGKRAIVKITEVHKWHVYGEIIEKNPKPIYVNFEHHFKGMYNVQKKAEENKILNEIKKEQEDIHATIKLNYKKDEKNEKNNQLYTAYNNRENINVINSEKKIDYSMIMLFISLFCLYFGLDRIRLF